MEAILYSTHCPRCKVLEAKLKEKNIAFKEIDDPDQIASKGISSVPYLEADGALMNFKEAVDWIKSRGV